MLDLAFVRRAFPALASGFIYLDNAGGSQVLGAVADRVRDYLLTTSVQLGASYAVSELAGERVRAAVAATASFMGAGDPHEIVIGASTTQLIANLALAMAPGLAPGDEIVITDADHHANVGAWQRLAARGVILRSWPVDPETLRLESRDLEPLLGPRTRLVAMTHVSNVIGTIHEIASIARLVHAHDARLLVDGVAYAPHRAIDVRGWDVDYYVFSFYKTFGPHLAALYGKRELLESLATINHEFITEVPYRLQPGNLNFELTHGVIGIYDYLAALGPAPFDAIAAHEEQLAAPLLAFLTATPGVRIFGEPAADHRLRVPTISFGVSGRSAESIVRGVDAHAIGIRHGDFYARRLVQALGIDGVVRVSMAHYNTTAEIARLIEVLAEVLDGVS